MGIFRRQDVRQQAHRRDALVDDVGAVAPARSFHTQSDPLRAHAARPGTSGYVVDASRRHPLRCAFIWQPHWHSVESGS